MSVTNGKEYQLAIKIAGKIDKSFNSTLKTANMTLKAEIASLNSDFTKLDRIGNAAFNGLVMGATAAVTAVGAIEVAAIKAGAGFEKQMSAVKAIAQASDEDLGLLKDKAKDLARTTVFTAEEVGGAMEYMGLAGWKTEQMLDGIEGVLNLAAASGEDLATISDIVTDDLTAFGMKAEETQRMVDVMAQTAMNSNTTVTMMGEAFKYAGSVAGTMGYKIEDLGVAVGTIASQGIKSSMAGTALRNMITRLVKPTKESSEAIEALGLSIKNDNGEMNSFMDIMLQLREGMKKYDVDKQAYYAAELGGQRGMAAIAAIANASEEDFEKLTRQIYHAEGAAERMSEVRLDNLAGDVQLLKDNVNDLGLTLYDQQDGPLREVVQMGTNIIKNFKKEVPAISKAFGKNIVPAANQLVDAGEWAVKNKDTLISVFEGFVAATLAYKTASTGVHIANTIASLSGAAPLIIGSVAAIGAGVAIFENIKRKEKELINTNLKDHFGDISLSLSEIDKIVGQMTNTKELEQISEALSRFDIAQGYADSMKESVDEINKLNWKVNVGLELTPDDQENYKKAIDSFVQNANQYVEEQRYAVSLQLVAGLGDSTYSSIITSKVDEFYENSQEKMSNLGTTLQQSLIKAFSDGKLDDAEATHIRNLQQQMSELQATLSAGRLDAELSLLADEYGWSGLDAESFQDMQAAMAESAAESTEVYRQAYLDTVGTLRATYTSPEGTLNTHEYEEGIKSAKREYLQNAGNAQMQVANAQIQGIMNAYKDKDLGTAINKVQGVINSGMAEMSGKDLSAGDIENQFARIAADAKRATGFEKDTQGALITLYDNMQPTLQLLENLKKEYEEYGIEVPAAYQECIDNIYAIGAAGGDEKAIYSYLGSQISDESKYTEYIAAAKELFGEVVPEEITNAMVTPENKEQLESATDTLKRYIKDGLESGTIDADIHINANLMAKARGNTGGNMTDRGYPSSHAKGGIVPSMELSWLAEDGPEAVIPINGSKSARSLWERVGQLMGMPSAFENIEIGGGGAQINFAPTLQFNGGAPSQDEINRAMSMSMDEFEARMDEYFKRKSRFSFA